MKTKIGSRNLILGVILLSVISVTVYYYATSKPYSKEAYLEQYAEYIETIANEREGYTEGDWAAYDKKYNLFNDEWYKEFEKELTFEENLIILKYKAQYQYYRNIP